MEARAKTGSRRFERTPRGINVARALSEPRSDSSERLVRQRQAGSVRRADTLGEYELAQPEMVPGKASRRVSTRHAESVRHIFVARAFRLPRRPSWRRPVIGEPQRDKPQRDRHYPSGARAKMPVVESLKAKEGL